MAHPFCDRMRRRPALLYGILDTKLFAPERIVETGLSWAEHGVDLIQLRAKDSGAGLMLELAQALVPGLRERSVPLLINDRVDVARLSGADGVHLGQEDMPAADARAILGPDRLLGWSTHDAAEVAASPPEADYLGFGAIYPTSTRENSQLAGPEALTGLSAATTLPIFAIGGIDAENLLPLGVYHIAGVAVASALRASPSESASRLRRALEHWS